MIQAQSITLSFGSRVLFDQISFDINEDQRIGLIGKNGSGKSTLLEAIVGLQQLDSGTITISKNKKIAYLAQDVVLASQLNILEETMTAFATLMMLKNELDLLEQQMSDGQEVDLERYAHLHDELKEANPEALAAKTKKMLLGLGFKEADFDKPIASLSIGWRMRIVLAKLLLQNADFYLFDEPTNHLDIFAKDWFLDFLKAAPFGFMLVCHERYFLDHLCKQIFELEMGEGTFYQGNFSAYEVQKEHNRALLEAAYVLQQKEIKQKEENIARFRASASRAKQAQSWIKQLEKVERIVLPPTLKNIKFSFPPTARSGSMVLKVESLGFSFPDKPIFKNVSFEIERGQKVAIVASNGGGKSTLFNIISGKLPMQTGSVTFGSNVTSALFDQDQNAALDAKKSVLDNIDGSCAPGITTATVRAFLGAFLFSGEDVDKKIGVLSGGEKNRVGMVKVLLQKANLLLLDEPTNHLDLDSKKVLLDALRAYEGTILFVSHDRAFLNDLATRIIELTPTGIISFDGNYDEYLYYKKHVLEAQQNKEIKAIVRAESKKELPAVNQYELNKKIKALERRIEQFEYRIREQELKFANLIYGTEEYKKAEKSLIDLKAQYLKAMKEWEEAHDFSKKIF
jgi:ATP-binding cassette subfamily F protein 3